MLKPRQTLRRLLPYYHPYRRQVAAGLVMVVTGAAMSNLIPALLERGIDAYTSIGNPSAADTLLRIAALMLAVAALGGLLRFGMRYTLNGVSRRIETDLRDDVFARLVSLDAAWYANWRTGDLMARLTNDLNAVRMAAGPALMYMVNTVAGGLFAMAMMIRISPLLTAAALLPMIGLPVLMLRLGKRIHQRFEDVQSQFGELTTRAQENLSGVRVVRAYRQEQAEVARFAALGDRYLEANLQLARLDGMMHPGFALLAGLGGAITLGVGGQLLVSDRITVGGFVAFGIYLAMLTWPMIALGWTTNLFQRGRASMSRVLELLDAMPRVVDDPGRAAGDAQPVATLPPPAAGGRTIAFRHVWFRYPTLLRDEAPGDVAASGAHGAPAHNVPDGEPRWVLRDISFELPAGSTLAVVGATGSGKSALLDLVPRLFDADRGEILVDGIPIASLRLDALRAEIGYVQQESLLFSETIGANIAYGVRGGPLPALHTAESPVVRDPALHAARDLDDVIVPAVIEATDVAQFTDTVTALPDGYATRLGERGINLSGGQKQRAALARALARDPHIVLLDDALSAVDTHTEAAILGGLRSALARRTAIIASHRVSTVRHADHIIVLDEGAIVEQGTHEALMQRGGQYATLLARQQLLDAIEAN